MSAPEVLSLEEVRQVKANLRPEEPLWTADSATVARLCATVEHYAHHPTEIKLRELEEQVASAAKDREDAQKWRTLMTEAGRSLRGDPDNQAEIEKAKRERQEAGEELRLLREWEAAALAKERAGDEREYDLAWINERNAWGALQAFRRSQEKEANP